MTQPPPPDPKLQRLKSHIPGLDTILGGGFFASGVYIVLGLPGSGKTIFANQLCYGQVANGGSAVYVTLLAESHARMLQHIRSLAFFDEGAMPNGLSYISAFRELEVEGLSGLMGVLRREMQKRSASVLVLDGLVVAAETATSDREMKKFVHELQNNAAFHGCTVFLLTSGASQRTHAEHTMVDGLIELEDHVFGVRPERAIQVHKFRGDGALRGKHSFRISDAGVQVFARIEALYTQPPAVRSAAAVQGLSTGVASLDGIMASRGLPRESATVVLGSTGTGKTTLALQFMGAASAAEPGLFFSFFEPPERLLLKADAFGLPLRELQRRGHVAFMWQPQTEQLIDELAHRLLDEVKRRKIKRLVIDGLAGFLEAATSVERIGRFLSCLTNELRSQGATVLATLETRDAIGSVVPTPYGVSGMVDNLFFLRFVEAGGRMQRLLSVLKMRDAEFNPYLHALEINASGIWLSGRLSGGGEVVPTAVPISEGAAQRAPDT